MLSLEWGTIRIFHNDHGKLSETSSPLSVASFPTLHAPRSTLHALAGWWNGVTTGDLDGDGRLDIIATNWGLNSKYHTSRERPLKIYCGDLDGNGTVEVIEAYYEAALRKEVPDRGLKAVSAAIPFLAEKWTS